MLLRSSRPKALLFQPLVNRFSMYLRCSHLARSGLLDRKAMLSVQGEATKRERERRRESVLDRVSRDSRESFGNLELPSLVGLDVAERAHDLKVLGLPLVQREAAHLGDVRAERAVHARAIDANEDAEVDRGPLGIYTATIATTITAMMMIMMINMNFTTRRSTALE